MKKIFILFMGMALFCVNSAIQAQVKVGDNTEAATGANLDLNSTGYMGGLLLPNVTITDMGAIPTTFSDDTVAGAADAPALAGMIVWDTATKSVYRWDGTNWILLPYGCTSAPTIPGTMTITPTAVNLNGTFTASVPNVAGVTYLWTLPSGLTGTSTTNSITITGDSVGTYQGTSIAVQAKNACGTSTARAGTGTIRVNYPATLGCVNSTLPVGKLCFMNYNLGANSTYTIDQQMAYASPTGNNVADSTVYGALYQWGRQTDGHQLRSAAWVTGPYTGPFDANGQIPSSQPAYYGHAVYNITTATFSDWRSPQDSTLWAKTKTINDPCPSGFRIPTLTEMQSICTNANSPNTWTWVSSSAGGTAGVTAKPDGSTVTLFLPAAGARSTNMGALNVNSGTQACLWTSSTAATSSSYALFNGTNSISSGSTYRSLGYSIRCLAEY